MNYFKGPGLRNKQQQQHKFQLSVLLWPSNIHSSHICLGSPLAHLQLMILLKDDLIAYTLSYSASNLLMHTVTCPASKLIILFWTTRWDFFQALRIKRQAMESKAIKNIVCLSYSSKCTCNMTVFFPKQLLILLVSL